jgi:hypothetical protein
LEVGVVSVDAVRLQKVVEKMSIPDGAGWKLDHTHAPEFFELINDYIKTAAYRSDFYDPEDAYAQVRFEIWRALERYGPRPNGQAFAKYTLKLKTNNILTNRAKKRKSYRSRLNYISSSYDEILEASLEGFNKHVPSYKPVNPCLVKEEIKERTNTPQKRTPSVKVLMRKITELPFEKKGEVFCNVASMLVSSPINNVRTFYKDLFLDFSDKIKEVLYINTTHGELGDNPYEKDAEMEQENKAEGAVQVGDKYISNNGKIFEIRKKIDKGFRVCVLCTGKETDVSFNYIKNSAQAYAETDETLSEDVEETAGAIEEEPQPVVVEEPKEVKTKVRVVPDLDDSSKEDEEEETEMSDTKQTEDTMARAGTQKALVVDMLKKGPTSRTELATAIMEAKLGKYHNVEDKNEFKKVTSYVSVIIALLEKNDNVKVDKPQRGVYQIKD